MTPVEVSSEQSSIYMDFLKDGLVTILERLFRFLAIKNEVLLKFSIPKNLDFSVKKIDADLRLLHEKNNETAVVTAIDL